MRNMYDVSDDGCNRQTVDSGEAQEKDRWQATKIHAAAIGSASLGTTILLGTM
jgi:hypothetical protein